jgi:hypothetical protein
MDDRTEEMIMKKLFICCALGILVIAISVRVEGANADTFALVDSNPINGQMVKVEDLLDRGIYLKFNNSVDRAYEQYIRIELLGEGRFTCQWNICGWVEYQENDTKVIWHPGEHFINSVIKPGAHLEIGIGFNDLGTSYNLRDTQGNLLQITQLDFSIDSCQPSVNLTIGGSPSGICNLSAMSISYFLAGDTVNVIYGFINPTCGHPIEVEVKSWVKLPNESLVPLVLVTHYQMAPGETVSAMLPYTFSGQESPGTYVIGLRILNPITGNHISTATTGFYFGACPPLPIF